MADDEPSKMESFKDKLSDIGQKVGEASKKAAKKTSAKKKNAKKGKASAGDLRI